MRPHLASLLAGSRRAVAELALNSFTIGAVSFDSFTFPRWGLMCRVQVALIFVERRAFERVRLAGLDPVLSGLRYRDALRIGGVDTLANVHRDRCVIGVGPLCRFPFWST